MARDTNDFEMSVHLGFTENSNLTSFLVFISLSLFLTVLWKYFSGGNPHLKKLPGPRGVPIFGNFFQLDPNPHIQLTKLWYKYGDIFRIYIGNRPVVIVNGIDTIKGALLKRITDFADRPNFPSFSTISGGKGMAFGRYGDRWKVHRKIGTTALRLYTSGRQLGVLQEEITNEMLTLVKILTDNNSKSGRVLDPQNSLRTATANIVFAMEFGKRYAHHDEQIQSVVRLADQFNDNVGGFANPVDYIPWLQYFPSPRSKLVENLTTSLAQWMNTRIVEHRRTYKPNVQRHIMDNLVKVSQEMDQQEKDRVGITEGHIFATMQDIFGAGFDTTATTIQWALLYAVKYPQIQAKIQHELDRVVGRNSLPTLDDRKNLIYTDAFILEILRHATVVPFTIPHSTLCATKLGDFVIPKDTVVFFNLWSVSHDTNFWTKPDQFNPERFLTSDGQSLDIETINKMIPFSAGRRKCLGEQLAKIVVFLAVAILFHQCEFRESDEALPNLDGRYGLALRPQPFMVHATQRL